MKVEKVDYASRMINTLKECDEWLESKDKAIAELEEAEANYLKAKKNVEDYSEENINEVQDYRDGLEAQLIALGIIEPKEEPKVDEVVDETVAQVDEKVDEQPKIAEFAPEIK